MAVKSKTALGRVDHKPGKPKKTRQGQGQHSLPNHGRKKKHAVRVVNLQAERCLLLNRWILRP